METKVKSFRLSPETIALIESWSGDSFTEKFCNLVNDAYLNRDKNEKRIRDMKRQRDELLWQISDLQGILSGLTRLKGQITRAETFVIEVEKTAKQLHDCMERIGGDPE